MDPEWGTPALCLLTLAVLGVTPVVMRCVLLLGVSL